MILCPVIQSFTATPNSGIVQTQVNAGYLRSRKDHEKVGTMVHAEWVLRTFAENEYMQAFYHSGIHQGVDRFLLDLQGLTQPNATTGLHEYECLMLVNSWSQSANTGQHIFTYGCDLEVKAHRSDPTDDRIKLSQAEALGNVSPFE